MSKAVNSRPPKSNKEDHTMSTKEMDSRAAEYFSIMETIEALQAEAEAIKDAMKAVMTERGTEELECI